MFESLSTHIYFFTKLFFSSIIERFALVRLSSQRELFVLEDYVLNIAKDTTDPKVEWSHQINNILVKIQNLQHMSTSTYWPNSSFETSTKLQPPNLDQQLCSKSDQNFSLKNSTKSQGQYLDQTLGSKYLPNINIKIFTKLKLQDLTWTLA